METYGGLSSRDIKALFADTVAFHAAVSEVTLRLWRNTAFASRDLSESLGG